MQLFYILIAIFDAGTAISLSEIRDMINDESNKVINMINSEVKIFLTEHFAEKIQFCPYVRADKSLFVFSSSICINDVVKRLRSLDTTKNVAEKLRKSFLEIDFDLNNKFCDGEDLLGSWDNLSLSDEILTFLGTLFNINPAKLLPKYPKKYSFDYFTQVPNSSDSNDESNSSNCDSLFTNDDESNVPPGRRRRSDVSFRSHIGPDIADHAETSS